MTHEELMALEGKRIKLIDMPDDPNPIPPGSTGTVRKVTHIRWGGRDDYQIMMNWDIGRSLAIIFPNDMFEVIE